MGSALAVDEIDFDNASLSAYLKEIGRNRILTRIEELALFDRIAKGDARAYNRLITANLKFVVSVSRQFRNRGLPMTDLISEGNLGLIRAAQKFDGTHRCRFISYAVWWIRQRIMRALAEQSRSITLPVAKAAAMRRIAAAEKIMTQRHARIPTPGELADYLDLGEKEVMDLIRFGRESSLDPDDRSGQGVEADAFPADGSAEDPEMAAMGESLRREVWDALEGLKESEREVLRLQFGIGSTKPMNLEEICSLLGITRAKVRKIRSEAINRLRLPVRGNRIRGLIQG